LHREWTDKIDPITYEVIRHNLWNINEELGMTIQRISGSPVAMYAACSEQGTSNFEKQAVPDAQTRCTALTLRRLHGPGYRH
jgi:hypothetical protein